MKKRRLASFVPVILVFLFLGLVLFKLLNQDVVRELSGGGFRAWFWDYKALDLIVQVTLVFAGRFGHLGDPARR